ncbi:MAG: LysM peptidoglycan-binding domain-containing protein [Treponema sp.]|jgi:hypothetical protein|nr:LysM peptidoglycan-binding domain-containing protein [Treponema sp.]
MASTIGIKIANGEFYPILEEYSAVKKRLILTTVHNKQASVHIDLYKSNMQTLTDALYIGSLVVENIKSKPKGEPSIELVISSNKDGEISANAVDLDTFSKKEPPYLNVSLKSLEEDVPEVPDFKVSYPAIPPLGLYEPVSNKKSTPWPVLVFIFICLILICFVLWFFLFRGYNGTLFRSIVTASDPTPVKAAEPVTPAEPAFIPKPEIPAASVAPEEEPETAATQAVTRETAPEPEPDATQIVTPDAEPEPETAAAEEPSPEPQAAGPPPESAASEVPAVPPSLAGPPLIEAPASPPARQAAIKRTRPSPPVASYKAPTAIPRGGVAYKIRWGDTLWDISEAFYRNPWLYPRIARFNRIRNPDLIISGTTIRVPPRR